MIEFILIDDLLCMGFVCFMCTKMFYEQSACKQLGDKYEYSVLKSNATQIFFFLFLADKMCFFKIWNYKHIQWLNRKEGVCLKIGIFMYGVQWRACYRIWECRFFFSLLSLSIAKQLRCILNHFCHCIFVQVDHLIQSILGYALIEFCFSNVNIANVVFIVWCIVDDLKWYLRKCSAKIANWNWQIYPIFNCNKDERLVRDLFLSISREWLIFTAIHVNCCQLSIYWTTWHVEFLFKRYFWKSIFFIFTFDIRSMIR